MGELTFSARSISCSFCNLSSPDLRNSPSSTFSGLPRICVPPSHQLCSVTRTSERPERTLPSMISAVPLILSPIDGPRW